MRKLTSEDELWAFLKLKDPVKRVDYNWGELQCLVMMYKGCEWLSAGEPIPFEKISTCFKNQNLAFLAEM